MTLVISWVVSIVPGVCGSLMWSFLCVTSISVPLLVLKVLLGLLIVPVVTRLRPPCVSPLCVQVLMVLALVVKLIRKGSLC